MTKNGWIKSLLTFLGCLSIVIGIGSGLYSYLVLRPKVSVLSDQLSQSLSALETTSERLENHAPVLTEIEGGVRAGIEMIDLVPETLISLQGTLSEAAELLDASSSAAHETTEGVTGIVAPDEELNATARLMRRTSGQLSLMTGIIHELQKSSTKLRNHMGEASTEISGMTSTSRPIPEIIRDTRARIQETRNAIQSLSVPTLVGLAGLGVGGIYIFFGLALLALSAVYGKLVQLRKDEFELRSVRIRKDKAA